MQCCSATGKLMKIAVGGGRLRPAWVARGFFASDILCLAIQGAGAGLSSNQNAQSQNSAKVLLIIGLLMQLGFFTMFTSITLYLNLKQKYGLRGVKQYKPVFFCLYATITLLYIRSIFRVGEFSGGWYGYVATHESYFYCFDFLMIFLAFVVFTIWHFGIHLQKAAIATESSVHASQKQHAVSVEPAAAGKGKEPAVPAIPIQAQAS